MFETEFHGDFISTGVTEIIKLPAGCDWIEAKNYTTTLAAGAGTGIKFEWQKGMAQDSAFETVKLAADESSSDVVVTAGGFTAINSSVIQLGAINATVSAVSNAATPVVSATFVAGSMVNGDTVRMINIVGGRQISGLDYTISAVTGTTVFSLAYMDQIVAATTGSFRTVKYTPLYSPGARFITKITKAASAVVTFSVTHDFIVGEKISFRVPADFDMVEMNGLTGTVTAVSAVNNTITVDIDSTAFTTFAWPLTADDDFTPAQGIAAGRSTTAANLALPDNALRNDSYLGMALAAGVNSPAGVATNQIFWRAGVSTKVV